MALETSDPVNRIASIAYSIAPKKRMPLPKKGTFAKELHLLREARDSGDLRAIRFAANNLIGPLSSFYGVPAPRVALQRARPILTEADGVSELHGRYVCNKKRITVWVHTAVRERVVAY